MKHLETILQNNALPHYLVAGAIALIIFFLLVGLRYFISTRIRRMTLHTATYWDDILVDVFASTSLVIIAALSVLSGLLALEKSPDRKSVV